VDIIEQDEKAEISCHFCNNKFHFNKEDLTTLLAHAKR
jgi:molecular chaperone Hsp33